MTECPKCKRTWEADICEQAVAIAKRGKLIAHKDLPMVKSEDVWIYGVSPELSHVNYWCLKCGKE
jgi:hypothetical protein